MTSTKTKQHGGKRKGSGRKAGGGTGRLAVTRSVSMLKPSWDKLDALRGEMSRGKFIETKL